MNTAHCYRSSYYSCCATASAQRTFTLGKAKPAVVCGAEVFVVARDLPRLLMPPAVFGQRSPVALQIDAISARGHLSPWSTPVCRHRFRFSRTQ